MQEKFKPRVVSVFCPLFLVCCISLVSVAKSEDTKPVTQKHRTQLQVGQKAPGFNAHAADGNVNTAEEIKGKVILLTYLSLKDKTFKNRIERIEKIRARFSGQPDFMIVNIWTDDFDEYIKYMNKRGSSFYSDSRMWNLSHITLPREDSRKHHLFGFDEIGVEISPRSFLISPDQNLLAVDISPGKMEKLVEDCLKNTSIKNKSNDKN